jgi:hypothetical protein
VYARQTGAGARVAPGALERGDVAAGLCSFRTGPVLINFSPNSCIELDQAVNMKVVELATLYNF